MTEKKIAISHEDYTSAFAKVLEEFVSQLENTNPRLLVSLTVAITRCFDLAWKLLEKTSEPSKEE